MSNFAGGKEVTKRIEDDIIIKELRDVGLKGKISIPPNNINIDELKFDDKHIYKDSEHLITESEAKEFISNAKFINKKMGWAI